MTFFPRALRVIAVSLAFGLCVASARGQQAERPRPEPSLESAAFRRAVARGTRTRTGRPGPDYWQQDASYRIWARLDPDANRLTGREVVHYVNHSPDTLRRVAVALRQNIFAKGAQRDLSMPVTGGMTLRRVVVGATGQTLTGGRALQPVAAADTTPGYTTGGTVAWIRLPEPVLPRGGTVDLGFAWLYAPRPAPGTREGQDGEVFMMGYWYPQLAVYDDVSGWAAHQYLGRGEFYMGYADYDVRLSAPPGWLVATTGTLRNAGEVLSEQTRRRLARARRTDEVVRVVRAEDRGDAAVAPTSSDTARWHFTASGVRSFAWATSRRYLWDAARAIVGAGAERDTVASYAFYRPTPEAKGWKGGARYNRNAIAFFSKYLWPYPWPQMTAVEGILGGGGMEYPMLTIIQSYRDSLGLAGNLLHEEGHMWFPMQVGSDEHRYAWMDEGLGEFIEDQGLREVYGLDGATPSRKRYLAFARAGKERPMMRYADLFPSDEAYFVASYHKPSAVFTALRAVVGEEDFRRALRAYGRRWTGKHPQPWDFFYTVEDVTRRDLGWFWRSWFFDTGTLDQAVGAVRVAGDSATITVENRGRVPMPVRLRVTRSGGSAQWLERPVDPWLAGKRRQTIRVPACPAITRVEIDPRRAFPDIDRGNDVFERQEAQPSTCDSQ